MREKNIPKRQNVVLMFFFFVVHATENFFQMPVADAEKALEIYRLFTRETDGLIQIMDISKKFSRTELPELQHV
jgi:hypothetical protein